MPEWYVLTHAFLPYIIPILFKANIFMISVMILHRSQHISIIFSLSKIRTYQIYYIWKIEEFRFFNMTVECGLEMTVIDQIMEKIATHYQRIFSEYPCLFVIKTSIRWKLHAKWPNLRPGNNTSLSVSEIRNYYYYILISSKYPIFFSYNNSLLVVTASSLLQVSTVFGNVFLYIEQNPLFK